MAATTMNRSSASIRNHLDRMYSKRLIQSGLTGFVLELVDAAFVQLYMSECI